jgi:hypothetical protein
LVFSFGGAREWRATLLGGRAEQGGRRAYEEPGSDRAAPVPAAGPSKDKALKQAARRRSGVGGMARLPASGPQARTVIARWGDRQHAGASQRRDCGLEVHLLAAAGGRVDRTGLRKRM